MSDKIINSIKLFFRIKFLFNLPKKNKILLYDEIHAAILKKIIKKDFNILNIRSKKIYFWIYLKQVIFFDFSFKTYSKNYIRFTSPKVIITFNDARFQMYELKSDFKNISFISVMNGLRFEKWFKGRTKLFPNNIKKFKGDYFFTLNKYYIPKYQKLLKSDYRILGHFRNNLVEVKKTKFPKQFLLISQIHGDKILYNFHKKLLYFINLYLTNCNKKLHILLRRTKKQPSQVDEINFYKKIFKSNCVFHESSKWKKKYQIMDKFENIIFSFSTMGYEAIARKKKVAIFAPSKFNGSKYYFGWPAPYQKRYNFFTAKNLTYKEVKRVLDNIDNCSQSNWNKKYYNIIKDQLYFDKNNNKLRKLILELIKIKM